MKIVAITSILLFCVSCQKEHTTTEEKTINSKEQGKTISEKKMNARRSANNDYPIEVMEEDAILFNGKLNRYFTLDEFEKEWGKADSIKLVSDVEPCVSIFENEDGSIDKENKYLYQAGSRFENTKDKVAVDEFRFTKNNFILYKGITLNASTSLRDLEKLFPNATKNSVTREVDGEGKLEVIQLREDENNISDGHIKLVFKNGKLYSMHWWFPC